MHTLSKKINFLLLFIVVFLSFSFLVVTGQTRVFRGQIIEPVFTVANVERGKSYTNTIKFFNDLEQDVTLDLDLTIKDFTAAANGQDKNENIQLPKNASLASWITLNKRSISVPKGKFEEIKFVIDVPKDAEYGGKYASISFERNVKQNDPATQIPLQTRLQHTILLNVEGNRVEKLQVVKFETDKPSYDDVMPIINTRKDNQGKNIIDWFPLFNGNYRTTDIAFLTDIKNIGNVHIAPKGKIVISGGWIGEGTELNFNPASQQSLNNVLPGSTRTLQTQWLDGNFRIGPYKALLTVEYTENGKPVSITSQTTFWIIPWKILLFVLIVILAIVLNIWVIKHFRNKRTTDTSKETESTETFKKM